MDEITPGVFQLSGVSGSGLWGGNVFLLVGSDLTLVDTGYRGGAKRIFKEVRRLGYSPSDLANIIITHHHADHVGNLAVIKAATQAKVITHPADAPYIDGRLPQPGPVRPQWLSKGPALLRRLWTATPAGVDILVNDNDELPILDGIKVVHTPGHTLGSICLFRQQQRLIIVGDLLANRFRLRLPSKMFTVDMAQDIHSIERLSRLDFDIICFGHGPPIMGKARSKIVTFVQILESKYQRAT